MPDQVIIPHRLHDVIFTTKAKERFVSMPIPTQYRVKIYQHACTLFYLSLQIKRWDGGAGEGGEGEDVAEFLFFYFLFFNRIPA